MTFQKQNSDKSEVFANVNRPFPSSPGPLFQNEGRCSVFDIEIIFLSHTNKTHFHKKGCAPSLILKVRVSETRKWPILVCPSFGSINSTCAQRYCYQLDSHLGVPSGNGLGAVPGFTIKWNNFLPIGKSIFVPTEISRFFNLNEKHPQ